LKEKGKPGIIFTTLLPEREKYVPYILEGFL
jgi:hypothetical protein